MGLNFTLLIFVMMCLCRKVVEMDFLAEPWDISAETDRLNQRLFGSHISPLGKVSTV